MRTAVIVGAIALAAFAGGVAYLKRGSADQSSATTQSGEGAASEKAAGIGPAGTQAAAAPASSTPQGASSQPGRVDSPPVPSDPRLAALKVSPDNGSIEFVRAPDGNVIAEIDKDPSSPSFKKPLREYMYSHGQVVGLTAYRYVGDRVEITRTLVAYNPDGSVDQFRESTSYESAQKAPTNPR